GRFSVAGLPPTGARRPTPPEVPVQPAVKPSPTLPAARGPWAALAVLMLPVLLVSVDNTVLSFALPVISEALAPTGQQLLWIVDVYPDRKSTRLNSSHGSTSYADFCV